MQLAPFWSFSRERHPPVAPQDHHVMVIDILYFNYYTKPAAAARCNTSMASFAVPSFRVALFFRHSPHPMTYLQSSSLCSLALARKLALARRILINVSTLLYLDSIFPLVIQKPLFSLHFTGILLVVVSFPHNDHKVSSARILVAP